MLELNIVKGESLAQASSPTCRVRVAVISLPSQGRDHGFESRTRYVINKYAVVSAGGSSAGFHPVVIAGSIPVHRTKGKIRSYLGLKQVINVSGAECLAAV